MITNTIRACLILYAISMYLTICWVMSSPLSWAFNIINILHTHTRTPLTSYAFLFLLFQYFFSVSFRSCVPPVGNRSLLSVHFIRFSLSTQRIRVAIRAIRFVCQRHRRRLFIVRWPRLSTVDLIPFSHLTRCCPTHTHHKQMAWRGGKSTLKVYRVALVLNFTSICSYASMCLLSFWLFILFYFVRCVHHTKRRQSSKKVKQNRKSKCGVDGEKSASKKKGIRRRWGKSIDFGVIKANFIWCYGESNCFNYYVISRAWHCTPILLLATRIDHNRMCAIYIIRGCVCARSAERTERRARLTVSACVYLFIM